MMSPNNRLDALFGAAVGDSVQQSHEIHKNQGTDKAMGYWRRGRIYRMTRVRRRGGEVASAREREREALLWLYERSGESDWLSGCVSAVGNRCDVFKQVGITGMSGIPPLYRTLDVLSPAGKLSLGHMLQSHITLALWLPASPSTPDATPPFPDHQLSCPHMGVTFTPALVQSNTPLLPFPEWK